MWGCVALYAVVEAEKRTPHTQFLHSNSLERRLSAYVNLKHRLYLSHGPLFCLRLNKVQNRVDENEVALAGYFDLCDAVNLGCWIVVENAGMF